MYVYIYSCINGHSSTVFRNGFLSRFRNLGPSGIIISARRILFFFPHPRNIIIIFRIIYARRFPSAVGLPESSSLHLIHYFRYKTSTSGRKRRRNNGGNAGGNRHTGKIPRGFSPPPLPIKYIGFGRWRKSASTSGGAEKYNPPHKEQFIFAIRISNKYRISFMVKTLLVNKSIYNIIFLNRVDVLLQNTFHQTHKLFGGKLMLNRFPRFEVSKPPSRSCPIFVLRNVYHIFRRENDLSLLAVSVGMVKKW